MVWEEIKVKLPKGGYKDLNRLSQHLPYEMFENTYNEIIVIMLRTGILFHFCSVQAYMIV